jgi:hypothetical protein
MAEKNGIEQIVERVVAQVLEKHVPKLRQELVRRVLDEVGSQLGTGSEAGAKEASAAHLLKAISAIQSATTQRDVLRALLDNAVRHCGRAALFVVKSGAATCWQGRALGDRIKDFTLDTNSSLVARVIESRVAVSGNASEMDQRFISEFDAPADGECLLLPLLLKEKLAALVYADAGSESGGHLNTSALELLVLAAGMWLEIAAQRKAAPKEAAAQERVETPRAAAAHASPSFADPFAAHAPAHIQADPVAPVHSVAEAAPAVAEPEPAPAAFDALSGMSSEDADVHRKAQRFARLLVDEIKLYNQAKLIEGRKNKDLYDRLKEDIDKSRATYQKRYGNTVAASADYFIQELVRSLAEDDPSLLGNNLPR